MASRKTMRRVGSFETGLRQAQPLLRTNGLRSTRSGQTLTLRAPRAIFERHRREQAVPAALNNPARGDFEAGVQQVRHRERQQQERDDLRGADRRESVDEEELEHYPQ